MKRILVFGCLLLMWASTAGIAAEKVGVRDHMRDQRYGEIILLTGGPLAYTGLVYNTIGLNDCPESKWKELDAEKLEDDFDVRKVILNGPRYFLMDRNSLANPGQVESFNGLEARLLATVRIPLFTMLRGHSKPYSENRVSRTSEYVFRKGRPVFELVSPKNRIYVMQSYSCQIDPELTLEGLKDLGAKLALPRGWTYRTRIPDEDFVVRADGKAYVLQDELQNSYQRVEVE